MSCNTYIHNDPFGGSKYLSGTTCNGTTGEYTLNYGDSICIDNSLPLITCNDLQIQGECQPITPSPTPTPTATPPNYRIAGFQVTNNGCGNQNISGTSFSITYNGVNYPVTNIVAGTVNRGIGTCIPLVPPSIGQTYRFDLTLDPNWMICTNTGITSFDRIDWSNRCSSWFISFGIF